ncbi:hypothetical protein BC332_26063 [Capsicum chinense]|nr:hypothetical protein BC332_26063 [Capsicum chinense]
MRIAQDTLKGPPWTYGEWTIEYEDCGEVTAKGVTSLMNCLALEDLLLRHNGLGIDRNFIIRAASRMPLLRKVAVDVCDAKDGDFDLPDELLTHSEDSKMQLKKAHIRFNKIWNLYNSGALRDSDTDMGQVVLGMGNEMGIESIDRNNELQVIEQILEVEIAEPSKIKRVRQKKTRILDVKTTLLRHNASLNEVTTYEKAHSCSVDFITSHHRNAISKVICDYMLELVRDSSNVITPNFKIDRKSKQTFKVLKDMVCAYVLDFGGGDMFQSIPYADAILLKLVMHNWSDEDCVKILQRCREARIYNDEGIKGKVLIIDMVLNRDEDEADMTEVKLLFDVLIMVLLAGEAEN